MTSKPVDVRVLFDSVVATQFPERQGLYTTMFLKSGVIDWFGESVHIDHMGYVAERIAVILERGDGIFDLMVTERTA